MKKTTFSRLLLLAVATMTGGGGLAQTVQTQADFSLGYRINADKADGTYSYKNGSDYWPFMELDAWTDSTGYFGVVKFDLASVKTALIGKRVTKATLRLTQDCEYPGNKNIVVQPFDYGDWAIPVGSTAANTMVGNIRAAYASDNKVATTVSVAKSMYNEAKDGTLSSTSLSDYQFSLDVTSLVSGRLDGGYVSLLLTCEGSNKVGVWGTVTDKSKNDGPSNKMTDDYWTRVLNNFSMTQDEFAAAVKPTLIVEYEDAGSIAATASRTLRMDNSSENTQAYLQIETWANKSDATALAGYYSPLLFDISALANVPAEGVSSAKVVLTHYGDQKTVDLDVHPFTSGWSSGTSRDGMIGLVKTYAAKTPLVDAGVYSVNRQMNDDYDKGVLGEAAGISDYQFAIDITDYVKDSISNGAISILLSQVLSSSRKMQVWSATATTSNYSNTNAGKFKVVDSVEYKKGIATLTAAFGMSEEAFINSVKPKLVVTLAGGYTLEVTSAGYSTLVLPFDAALPSGVSAYNLTVSDTTVRGEKVSTITKNKPVLIKAAQGSYAFTTDDANDIVYAASPANGALVGTYKTTNAADGNYVLQSHDGTVAFYQLGEGGNHVINPFRAYLTAPTTSEAKSMRLVLDGMVTAIQGVSAASRQDNRIFDLTGRELRSADKPGLYIINGKKTIIK